ncbi:MAG: Gfo/Idh/MocA family oxidoreductase, partial [Thermoguttaceae bacterium]
MMNTPRPLRIACIGCGSRAQTYTALAARRPERFQIVAGADPVDARVEKVRHISGRADFRGFASAEAILAAGNIADVMIVATQDNDHYCHCRDALQAGYHVLLEKPISTNVGQVLEIEAIARKANRHVMVCFVLRFAAFYRK